MKFFMIAALMVILMSCHRTTPNLKGYQVKFSPQGESDHFRDTLFIGSTNKYFPSKMITRILLLASEDEMQKLISFIQENNINQSRIPQGFGSFGSFNISLFSSQTIVTNYNLNPEQSRKYFISLIELLEKDKGDPNLIKVLKEEILARI